ncbi:Flavin-linked sulfhydryl oxidase of the mitochondrial IMS [Thecaphora frezii]
MPTFPSRPLRRSNSAFSRLGPKVRQRPVLFFGVPFLVTIVGASFGLSMLTQTRYDYNATKVQTISKEEELRMKKDRKKVDIREEYFRLQSRSDELEDWEPKRIARPEGVPEWGVPPTSDAGSSRSKIQLEPLSAKDEERERALGITPESLRPSAKHATVVLGPDGKPCRACNSKLAFSAAMKGALPGSGSGAASKAGSGGKTTTAAAAAAATASAASIESGELACPPDGEEIGRSTWTFLHSAAAYYPSAPSSVQQSSMLALLHSLPHLYPCHSCAEALGEEYRREQQEGGWEERSLKMQEAARTGPALRKWLCGIHNEVNQRLGKPKFECTEQRLNERWRDGPKDGRCD